MTKPAPEPTPTDDQNLSPQQVRIVASALAAIVLHGRECYGRKIKASDAPAIAECFRRYIEGT
jgi:hypothetical protein